MDHEQDKFMNVEVVYALADKTHSVSLQLPEGATAEQAIRQSGLLQECPDIDLTQNKIGIFSQVQPLDVVLSDQDRVEIYRPLLVDPKESRRRRAGLKQKTGDIP